ncbi:gene transfer agent family protein [Paracoccus sp. (in: a-proteobacteria)]|uniref:gene transfer agent family protein n=1 Tax=Paracoccus sp. TaxID=267 RepID=UPI0028ABBC01|nr:gene transfer agent family protein [Paracoccus sp. (in: a-proteobacteria)]
MQPLVVRWPGGEHAFRLGLGELRAIQQNTDCGPEYLRARIDSGLWHVDDLREVFRNGLIGGGMGHVEALKLVDKAFDTAPAVAFKAPASVILAAYLYGPPEDAVGEDIPVGPAPKKRKKTGAGSSAPTTA